MQQNRASNVLNRIVLLCFFLLGMFYIYSIYIRGVVDRYLSLPFGIAVYAAGVFLVYKLGVYVSSKFKYGAEAYIFLLSLALYIPWTLAVKPVPSSDYAALYQGAMAIIEGRFPELSFAPDNYFYIYNFQIGQALLLSLEMRIVGTSYLALALAQNIILALTNVVAYRLAYRFLNKDTAMMAAVLFLTQLTIVMGSGITNNQHVSLLFSLLACCLASSETTKTRFRVLYYIAAGLLFSGAFIVRQSAITIFLSCIVFLLLAVLRVPGWRKKLVSAALMLLVPVSFFTGIQAYDRIMIESGMAPVSAISSNVKYFKFLLGMGRGTGLIGRPTEDYHHTQIYFDLEYFGFDYDLYNNTTEEYLLGVIQNRESRRLVTVNAIDKMTYFAGGLDEHFVLPDDIEHPFLHRMATRVLRPLAFSQYKSLVFFTMLSVAYIIVKIKKMDQKSISGYVLFALMFLAVFCAHVPIEVHARYRFDQYYSLSVFAAPVILGLSNNLLEYSRKVFDKG